MGGALGKNSGRRLQQGIFMNTLRKISLALLVLGALEFVAAATATAAGDIASQPAAKAKNWTQPAHKIYAQTLSDEIMTAHHELISVTFHGVPPGMQDVYTMFAGSYPDRIGNPDDPDDIDVITKGITIVDPRWHRIKDAVKKFVVQLPLRDASGENVGLIVFAYHNESSGKGEKDFFLSAVALRDALQKKIPSYAGLFEAAK
jgi:hypothetical protein